MSTPCSGSILGVYQLEGDQLKICLDWRVDTDTSERRRPTAARAELGSQRELLVLRRVGEASVEPDEEAVQGTWKVLKASATISEVSDGHPKRRIYHVPHGEIAPGREVLITRSCLTIKGLPRDNVEAGTARVSAAGGGIGGTVWNRRLIQPMAGDDGFLYALDPSQHPKRIDFVGGGIERPCPGIYRLEDDRLKIRLGKQLPTEIDAPPGDDQVVLELKRMPDKSRVEIDEDGDAEVKGTLPDAANRAATAAKSDLEAIQGTWRLVNATLDLGFPCLLRTYQEASGKRATTEQIVRTTELVITADALKVQGKHVMDMIFKYQINPGSRPRIIDFRSGGTFDLVDDTGVALGAYELEGDQLKICSSSRQAMGGVGILRPTRVWKSYEHDKEFLALRRVGEAVIHPDEKAIQGTWSVVSVQRKPKVPAGLSAHLDVFGATTDEEIENSDVLVTRHEVCFKPRNKASSEPKLLGSPEVGFAIVLSGVRFGYVLDPSKSPKTIDITLGDCVPCLGIYQLEGDRLKIYVSPTHCISDRRPTKFANELGDNEVVLELKRVPEPGDPAAQPLKQR